MSRALDRCSQSDQKTNVQNLLQLSLDPELVEVLLHLVLVLEQPVNSRLVLQGLADDLGSRLAVDVEESLVFEVVNLDHGGIELDRVDDSQVVDLVFGNHPGADRVEHAMGDRRLHGSHRKENQRVAPRKVTPCRHSSLCDRVATYLLQVIRVSHSTLSPAQNVSSR